MKYKAFYVFWALMLCFITYFATPVFASDGGEEVLTVNAAWLDGEMLRINVTDAYGKSSSLALRLSDYVNDAENNEFISIQAVDLEGNKSGVVQIKNPYYVPPTDDLLVKTPPETTGQSQSAMPDENTPNGQRPFTPDGTGSVMDNAESGDGKEFFTINTEDGNEFYLIVDRQRNADNVYLLNSVTEDDLMALAQKSGKTINTGSSSAIPTAPSATDQPEQDPTPTTSPEPEAPPTTKSNNNTSTIAIVVVVLLIGGAAYYFKIVKGKKNAPDAEEDEGTGDEDEGDKDWDFVDEPDESGSDESAETEGDD